MTWYDPERHHRRSIRLRGFDYARPGTYFVTICTRDRKCLFGDVVDGQVILNEYGCIVREEWARSAKIRDEIEMDEFIVMPNHLHGIVIITSDAFGKSHSVGAHGRAPLHRAPKSLGSFIGGFKAATTRRINQMRGTPGMPLWQRNYYEHVIRDEDELNQIRTYVAENPLKWELDENHPSRLATSDRLEI